MADEATALAPVESPAADPSPEAIAAAFANPQPYNPAAPVEAPAAAPAEAPVPSPVAPAPAVAAETAPPAEAPAAPAFDPAAYLKETFGVDAPEVLKERLTLAEQAEQLKANQRTDADRAIAKLFEDEAAGAAYWKLQTTDFSALSDRELHAAAYAHAHPELKPDVAAIRARREYDAEFAAAEFDDPDDPAVAEAKVLAADMRASSLAALESAKTAAREAVLAQATPPAEGPTPEQQAAQALQAAHAEAWSKGVENVINAESLALAYDVDGQEVKLQFDPKHPAYREFVQDPIGYLEKEFKYDPNNPTATDFDRVAEIGAWLTQRDVMLKNTLAVGKAALGPVIPLTAAVNPITNAPQAPAEAGSVYDAFRQAESTHRNRSTQY